MAATVPEHGGTLETALSNQNLNPTRDRSKEEVMKRGALLFILLATATLMRPADSQAQRGHDYPPFAAVDGSHIYIYDDKRFDFHDFKVDDTGKKTRVEGHKITIDYSRVDSVSSLELQRTLEAQANTVNAQILFDGRDSQCGQFDFVARFERNGKPIWFEAAECGVGGGGLAEYTIVEEQEFRPLTHLSQQELQNSIDTTGKAVLHINFAFDRATLQPDAAPTIQEILGILQAEPSLKLEVDGHTDRVGTDDYNQRLSEARAATVVSALTKAGIDGNRLKSAGFGASQPIAGNDTEQGRAENRRVELIRE